MNKVYNIGIIGKGFVGSAVAHGFSAACGHDAKIRIYDTRAGQKPVHFYELPNMRYQACRL